MRSLKANLLPRLWPNTMCASSWESTAARLASSGSTSTGPGQIDVVGNFQIVHDGLENAVNVALGREQARVGEALDDVVFRLLLPNPLSLQGRGILRGRTLVGYA